MVTSRCLEHNLPVRMDFDARLWRTGETNRSIKDSPMKIRLARSMLAFGKRLTGFDFENFVRNHRSPNRTQEPYEPEVMQELSKIHGLLFVDIGANVGRYSRALAKNFGKVYAFEPNPENSLDHLPKNVSVFRYALSNEDSERDFYLSDIGGGGADTLLSVFEYKPASETGTLPQIFSGSRSVKVRVSKYDLIVGKTADLVKIDVEGAEFLVLEGMKDSLQKRAVRNLMVELHNVDREHELLTILKANFPKVTRLDSHPRYLASLE